MSSPLKESTNTYKYSNLYHPDARGPSYAGVGPSYGGVWTLKSLWYRVEGPRAVWSVWASCHHWGNLFLESRNSYTNSLHPLRLPSQGTTHLFDCLLRSSRTGGLQALNISTGERIFTKQFSAAVHNAPAVGKVYGHNRRVDWMGKSSGVGGSCVFSTGWRVAW